MKDTWPERIGIPLLKESEQRLVFVINCLNDEEPSQALALDELKKGLKDIQRAIALLDLAR